MRRVMASFTILSFFNAINSFFDYFFCSSDQWLLGRHDLGAWYYLPGLLQIQSNSTGKFQLLYRLFQQQSTMRNKIPVIQSFSFKYCFVTQTWSNYPLLASLGNTTEDSNRNFARGSLTELFLCLISFTNWSEQPKLCKGFFRVAFSPSTCITPESDSDFNSAAKK